MSKLRSIAWLVGAVSMAVWLDGCGSSPTSPSDTTTPTITITDAGVSPAQLRISVGDRVLIINNGQSIHELQSDEHDVHLDCPPMNQPGVLNPGGGSGFTDAFTLAGTCGFHDHRNPPPGGASFQGFVLVNVNEPDPDTPPAY